MRLHLLSFPHTQVSDDFCGCAFTAKVLKFVRMMRDRGHELLVYAPEGPPIEGAELVPVLSNDERVGLFGEDDPNRLPAWPSEQEWRLFNARAIAALLERGADREQALSFAGYSHNAVMHALPHLQMVEPGVGYEGIFTDRCAFESSAWRHYLYGKKGLGDGRWFDTVIPNYFDPVEFPRANEGGGDYLVFLGRLIARKGPHVAAEIAREAGMRLVVAGAGATSVEPGKIVAPEVTLEGDHVEYVGPVGVDERAELLAGARALLAPTTYVEPFGGVAVEAMMAGTPAITTSWGAFSETVEPGVTGFHFSTLQEGIDAVEAAGEIDNARVRERALERFSLEAVAPMYERWLPTVASLWGEGWYARRQEEAACS